MLDHVKALEKELARLKSKLAASQGDDLVAQAVEVKGVKVLAAATLEGADAHGAARDAGQAQGQAEERRHRAGQHGKVSLIAGVTARSA
jgi:alanyl-tRNA synthetase